MRIRAPQVTQAPLSLWQSWYSADDRAVPSQSPSWLAALVDADGYSGGSRLYEFETGRRVICPTAERRVAGHPLVRGSWPAGWTYGGLLVDGGGPASQAELAAILSDLSVGSVTSRFVPVPGVTGPLDQSAPRSGLLMPLRTHVVTFGQRGSERSPTPQLTRQARQSVRKAERQGVEISRSRSSAVVEEFDVLYRAAQSRWGQQRGHPALLTRWRARRRHAVRQVRSVLASCGEEVTLWKATWQGAPVAVHVVMQHGSTAHDWLGAVDPELARATGGTYLLEASIIRQAGLDGCRWINLGESDPGGPVEQHKRRLGATALDYEALHMDQVPVTKVATRLGVAVSRRLSDRASS